MLSVLILKQWGSNIFDFFCRGGFTAQLRYKELDHARAGYKYGLTGKDCEGNPFKIRPILHINGKW